MAVSQTTPAFLKFKTPFENNSAVFDITTLEVTNMDSDLSADGNMTAVKTSTAGNEEMDVGIIDFGIITHASHTGSLKLVDVDFKFRVLNHLQATCGSVHWVSIGVEYLNHSVFAAQLSTTVACLLSPRPALEMVANTVGYDKVNVALGSQVGYDVTIKHGSTSSAVVQNGTIEWIMPSFLLFANHAVKEGVVTVTGSGSAIQFKFGVLNFNQKIKLNITADVTNSPLVKQGKVIDFTASGKLRYNAPANLPCSSSSGSRLFVLKKPVTVHHKYYKTVDECDSALGMESGDIADSNIQALSYGSDTSPTQARLHVGKGWSPSGNYKYRKNQYLQVEFPTRKKIRRLATQMGTQGVFKGRTTAFNLLYSDDGIRWTGYKETTSLLKEFTGNTVEGQTQYNFLHTAVDAKFVRIVPTKWEYGMALRAEFYGCNSLSPAPSPGPITYFSRVYLLDNATNTMYICSNGIGSKPVHTSCYFTTDNGKTWKAIDHRVMSILGYDPDTKFLYGVHHKRLVVMESGEEHHRSWKNVPISTLTQVYAKPNKVLSIDAGKLTITDDPLSVIPQAPHVITANNGQKWGVSSEGIYVNQNGAWKRKASWDSY